MVKNVLEVNSGLRTSRQNQKEKAMASQGGLSLIQALLLLLSASIAKPLWKSNIYFIYTSHLFIIHITLCGTVFGHSKICEPMVVWYRTQNLTENILRVITLNRYIKNSIMTFECISISIQLRWMGVLIFYSRDKKSCLAFVSKWCSFMPQKEEFLTRNSWLDIFLFINEYMNI